MLGDLADCSATEANAHEAVLDAGGEKGVLGNVADCSAPEADALEAALDADGDSPWSPSSDSDP